MRIAVLDKGSWTLNSQVTLAVGRFLSGSFFEYRADLSERWHVNSLLLPKDEKGMVPEHYINLDIPKYVNFWVKLTEIHQFEFAELQKLQVFSSVLPLSETLYKSSSGHSIVRQADIGAHGTYLQ